MSQQQQYHYVRRRAKVKKSALETLWDWLESLGSFFILVGRFLLSWGWALKEIANFVKDLINGRDWREDYR